MSKRKTATNLMRFGFQHLKNSTVQHNTECPCSSCSIDCCYLLLPARTFQYNAGYTEMYNCTAHWKTALTPRARYCHTMEPLRKDALHQKLILFGGHFFETSCLCKSKDHTLKHYALVRAPLIKDCLHRKPFPFGGHLL